jgi:hypothetical protein
MMVSTEIKAAVGVVAMERSFMEFLAARLVVIAGDAEWTLLNPRGNVFDLARQSAAAMQDAAIRQRSLDWLKRAEDLQGKCHRVIHSVALVGHSGSYGVHPKSRTLVPTQEVLDLAQEAQRHADEGNYMSVFDWPPAFGHQSVK